MNANSAFVEDLQDLYDNAPCGYVSFFPDGTIVNINKTLLEWIEYDKTEVLHKMKFQDLISKGERIFYETHFAPLLEMQKSVEEINFTIVARRKKRIPVLTSTEQRNPVSGASLVNRMTVFNITDRKKFEVELVDAKLKAEAALRAKSDFLSMLSHEIRTPLTAVIGASNMLDGTVLNSEQKEFAEMLKHSSESLMNLLNSILDLSKIESGTVELEYREFDCRLLVAEISKSWQAKAKEQNTTLENSVQENLPATVCGDAIKLGQMLNNLIGNAIKFTKNGTVKVRVRLSESTANKCAVIFEIEDSGVGMTSDQLEHIFDEFKQAEFDTVAQYGGSGLGLTIVKKLAEMHGTTVQVESQVGHGSIFRFDIQFGLPLVNAQPAPTIVERDFESLAGLHVLVADDSADNLFLVRHYLKKWGVRSETATDGREAYEKILQHDFDMAFIDLHMPIMDGYEATKNIRAISDKTKATIPIVAFSASTKFGGIDIVESMPISGLLGKPFRPIELFDAIAKHARVNKK